MCFWNVKSKKLRWIRVCVLWTVLFIGVCLYFLHSKSTLKSKAFAVDYKYRTIHDNNNNNTGILSPGLKNDEGLVPDFYQVDDEDDGDQSRRLTPAFTRIVFNNSEFQFSNTVINNSTLNTADDDANTNIGASDLSNLSPDKNVGVPSSVHPTNGGSTNQESINNGQRPSPVEHESSAMASFFYPNYRDIVKDFWVRVGQSPKSKGHIPLPTQYKVFNVHWTIRHSGLFHKSLYQQPPGEYPKQRLPEAILIGVGKCGTRAVIEFLRMHPYVVPARQEVHFFDVQENFGRGLDWYLSHMPLSFSNQITVEKTPSYIWSYVALREIRKMNKDIKLLVILRDPVERVIAQSIRTSQDDINNLFLEKEEGRYRIRSQANTVQWSIYVKYLRWWLEQFPLKQIHIIEAKELAADPAKEMKRMERFLGVEPRINSSNFFFNESKGFYCMRPFHIADSEIECLSEGKGRKHPDLEPWLTKLLYDFFRPYNEELYRLLGRRFDWDYKEENGGNEQLSKEQSGREINIEREGEKEP